MHINVHLLSSRCTQVGVKLDWIQILSQSTLGGGFDPFDVNPVLLITLQVE